MKYTIECELFGALKREKKNNKFPVEINAGSTFEQLLVKQLKFAKNHIKFFTVLSDGLTVDELSDKIPDEAKVKILMPVGVV
jgi:hypothetical protein